MVYVVIFKPNVSNGLGAIEIHAQVGPYTNDFIIDDYVYTVLKKKTHHVIIIPN